MSKSFQEVNVVWRPGFESISRCKECGGFLDSETAEKERYVCPNCGPVFQYQK